MSFEDLQRALTETPKKRRDGQDDDEDDEEGDDEDTDGEGTETDDDEHAEEGEQEEENGSDDENEGEEEGEEEAPAPEPEKLAKNYKFTKVTDPKLATFLRTLRKGVSVEAAALEAGYTLPQAREAAGADAGQGGKAKGATAEEIAAQAAARTAEVLKPHTAKVDEIKAQIAALEKTIEEKDARYEKYSKETIQLADKKMELYKAEQVLEGAKANHEAGERWMANYTRERSTSIAKAIELYPETGKKGSPQYWMVMAARTQLENEDPNFINDPTFPLKVIAKLEKELPDVFNKKSAGKNGKPAEIRKEVVQGAPPKQKAREVGSKAVSGNRTANIKLTDQNIDAMLDKLSPEELAKLGDLVGTKPKKRGS